MPPPSPLVLLFPFNRRELEHRVRYGEPGDGWEVGRRAGQPQGTGKAHEGGQVISAVGQQRVLEVHQVLGPRQGCHVQAGGRRGGAPPSTQGVWVEASHGSRKEHPDPGCADQDGWRDDQGGLQSARTEVVDVRAWFGAEGQRGDVMAA